MAAKDTCLTVAALHGSCCFTTPQVDPSVIGFFVPTAERLLASGQPARVLAASLAALAGFRAAPKPRSLLTYEEGMITLRLLGRPGA